MVDRSCSFFANCAITEAYIRGGPTNEVKGLVQELGGQIGEAIIIIFEGGLFSRGYGSAGVITWITHVHVQRHH